ncbi:hypothetical protein WAE56_19000 [Iodobacter sp. LRB]|uniref:hypothetical protein n=1 Tax=unclassified Iodobacter TaxID=235634 RepID=UPI00211ED38A|nr:hypothetical protein [Iodobacter sp. BJB302]
MYFLEWTTALGRRKHRSGSWFDQIQKDIAEEEQEKERKALSAGEVYDPDARQTDVRESRSELVDDNHAIYAKTDSYLDVCTYNDDKRGLITPVIFCFLYGIIPWWLSVFEYTSSILLTGLQPDGSLIDGEAIAVIGIDLLALPFLSYVFSAIYLNSGD